jgi:hypothetical protein
MRGPCATERACARLSRTSDEFGDISKEAAGAAKSGIEQVMRKATGDEEYKFGDVTKNLAKGFLGKLSEATEAAKTKLEDEEDQKKK